MAADKPVAAQSVEQASPGGSSMVTTRVSLEPGAATPPAAPDAAQGTSRVYEFKMGESMARGGWFIVKQRIASGSGSWTVVASVLGERRAEIVRDALCEEANERV